MADFEKDFLYPLYLLLISGAITGGLVKTYTILSEGRQKRIDRTREDHKKELQIKSELAQKMGEIVGIVGISVYAIKKEANPILVTEHYREWYRIRTTTRGWMAAYIGQNSDIYKEWNNYDIALALFWGIMFQKRNELKTSQSDFKKLKEYFEDKVSIDWEKFENENNYTDKVWNEFNAKIFPISQKMVKKMLNEKIVFEDKKNKKPKI